MTSKDDKNSPLVLEGYKLNLAQPEELGLTKESLGQFPIPPLRLTLCGQCFTIAAMDPIIKIGSLEVKDFETQSDNCSIICYLYETPEQGAIISIDYGRGYSGEYSEPFSMSNLNQDESLKNE